MGVVRVRVERNTECLLELLAEAGISGTFFVLGWIAERHPILVRRIAAAGHELASHGLCHVRVDRQTPDAFRDDVRTARAIVEDIAGERVRGYRAATFSIGPGTPWAWSVLEEEGFAYSSSVYPVARDLYALPPTLRVRRSSRTGPSISLKIPIATVRFANRNWPSGGGGFFRILPYGLSRAAIAHVNRVDQMPAVFYIHPWEVDPEQPRAAGIP